MKGRNDLCFCGSGRKYKKCHLPTKEHHWRTVNELMKQAEAAAAMLPAFRVEGEK